MLQGFKKRIKGRNYGDIMDLTKKCVVIGIDGDQWLMANRNKTGSPFKIPILPAAFNVYSLILDK